MYRQKHTTVTMTEKHQLVLTALVNNVTHGRRRPSTTLDHYSDLFENDLDELGNALGAMRSRLNVDDSWMTPPDAH